MPEFELPAVPEIEIEVAVADSNAITVAAMPVASAAASPTIASVTTPKLVSEVEYVREPVAKYPAAARTMKQSGVVTLRVLIDASGRAREVNVHRSSGYKLLDDAARKAVLSALFKPYTENGSAQPVYVLIPIEFGTA
jgi:protein TonB